ncbi:hypothetical protein SLE2022_205680 [Rubroshorea leprosula]
MNFMASEYSSGCESGWTLYLEQSSVSARQPEFDQIDGVCEKYKEKRSHVVEEVDDEEEEDSSMVSDASSGPPHFHENDGFFSENRYHHYPASEGTALVQPSSKRQRNKEHQHRKGQEMFSFLDDTASSPPIKFSQNNLAHNNNQSSMESVLDYSHGFSATHFEERPLFQDHRCFFQSSLSSNQMQGNQWY